MICIQNLFKDREESAIYLVFRPYNQFPMMQKEIIDNTMNNGQQNGGK